MKKLLLLSTAITMSTIGTSQITINQSNFASVGDQTIMASDTITNHTVLAGGTNLTFDFSSLNGHELDTINFVATSSTPYASDFPSSNITIDYSDGSYGFVNSSASSIELLGAIIFGEVGKATNSQTVINFPAAYGNHYSDTYQLTGKTDTAVPGLPVDSVRVTINGTKYSHIDAWGTLTTPLALTNPFDVLRVNDTIYETTITDVRSAFTGWTNFSTETDTIYSHSYFTDLADSKFTLLTYEYDPVTGQSDGDIEWAKVETTTSIKEKSIDFDIYPNPTTNKISVTSDEKIDELIVTSIIGKVVLNNQNKSTIDISSLVNGNYFISVKSGNKTSTQKFIKN